MAVEPGAVWHWLVQGTRGLVELMEQQHATGPAMGGADLDNLESYARRLEAVIAKQRETRGDE